MSAHKRWEGFSSRGRLHEAVRVRRTHGRYLGTGNVMDRIHFLWISDERSRVYLKRKVKRR